MHEEIPSKSVGVDDAPVLIHVLIVVRISHAIACRV